MMARFIEVCFGAKQDLHDILTGVDQVTPLPNKLQRLVNRSGGTSFTTSENFENWYLWRAWAEPPDGMDEFDYANPVITYLDDLFTTEWHWCRPAGVYWFDTGMQLGTVYANTDGDVVTNDPTRIPWFPLDYGKLNEFCPPITVGGTEYNLVHDMRPTFVTSGQFADSKGQYNLQRRVQQVTNNTNLGAANFGLDPWTPDTVRTNRGFP